MNEDLYAEPDGFEKGLLRAYWFCTRLTFGFAVALGIVLVIAFAPDPGFASGMFTIAMAGAIAFTVQSVHRRVSGMLSHLLFAAELAALVGLAFYLIYVAPPAKYASTISIMLATVALCSILAGEKHQRTIASYDEMYALLRQELTPPLSKRMSDLVFAISAAAAVSLVANIPTVRPVVMACATASAAIVTLSLGCFVVFVAPDNKPDE